MLQGASVSLSPGMFHTWSFNDRKVIFVPCDVGSWHPAGETAQRQSAAAVHVLIGQVVSQRWAGPLCGIETAEPRFVQVC